MASSLSFSFLPVLSFTPLFLLSNCFPSIRHPSFVLFSQALLSFLLSFLALLTPMFLISFSLCITPSYLCLPLTFPFLLKPSSHYASFTLLDAHHERQIHGTYRGCHHPSQIPNSFCPEIHLVCQTCPGRDSVILQGILLSVQHYASLIMCSFYCGYLSYLFSTEQ